MTPTGAALLGLLMASLLVLAGVAAWPRIRTWLRIRRRLADVSRPR
jgi:hypothetical protein